MWSFHFAVLSATLSEVALIVTAGGGVIGILVTFARLKPDMESASVAQAHNTMDGLSQFNQQLIQDRDQWRVRALEAEKTADEFERTADGCRKQLEACQEELERCRARHPPRK